jgi:hypothetical protein
LGAQLRRHLDAEGFADIDVAVLGGESPGRTDPDHPFLKLVAATAEPVYGMPMQAVIAARRARGARPGGGVGGTPGHVA